MKWTKEIFSENLRTLGWCSVQDMRRNQTTTTTYCRGYLVTVDVILLL